MTRIPLIAGLVFPGLLLTGLLFPAIGRAEALKLATWNFEWLTARPADDPALPPDLARKQPGDVERLHNYAALLAADVVAFEGVDGPEIAAQVFTPDRYAVHITDDRVVQRAGFAVRRGLRFTANPDLASLDVYPNARHRLRSGADITLELRDARLRLLALHLKAGCRQEALTEPSSACDALRDQLAALHAWVAERQQQGIPFLVMGDFNRWMDAPPKRGSEAFLADLTGAAPLTRATEGRSSPCWGGGRFIDHILAGGAARGWMQPDTLRVLVYRETGPEWQHRLSSHCPVSVRLRYPD